jgi:hypothetical protein
MTATMKEIPKMKTTDNKSSENVDNKNEMLPVISDLCGLYHGKSIKHNNQTQLEDLKILLIRC